MPDSPELMNPEYDEVAPLWAQIRSVERQSEMEAVHHHTYDESQFTALQATALALRKQPPNDVRVYEFKKVVGCLPSEFLEEHRSVRNC
jgi:hypothetical protein